VTLDRKGEEKKSGGPFGKSSREEESEVKKWKRRPKLGNEFRRGKVEGEKAAGGAARIEGN